MAQRVESKRRAPRDTGGLPGWLWGVIGAVIGLVLGLIYAWNIAPVTLSNYLPDDLSPSGRRIWVEMAADAYWLERDSGQAQFRLVYFTQEELRQLIAAARELDSVKGNPAKQERLNLLESEIGSTILGSEGNTTAPESSGLDMGMLGMGIGGVLLAAALLLGGAVVFTRLQQAQVASPRREGGSPPTAARRGTSTRTPATLGPPPTTGKHDVDTPEQPLPTLERESEDYPFPAAVTDTGNDDDLFDQLFEDTRDDVDEAANVAVADAPRRDFEFAEPALAAPTYSAALDQFLARYNYGDDGYDMSFSIETPQTEFLGECGVGICEVLSAGSPQKVTAFEVWLFDKDDIRTVTKVLLSDHAAASEELRGKLAPKGELVTIKPGDTVDLETKSLRVRARVRELEYGKEGTARSYFERFVVELTPQQKV
jgi:hypothetical protein